MDDGLLNRYGGIVQLPKTRRRQKLREKKCQYPGCDKTFFGIHIAKYCHEHRKDRYRIRKRTAPEDVNKRNQTINHTYTEVVTMEVQCSLFGCEEQFEIKVYPRQYVYPKYCPKHRSEYRRVRHLENMGRQDLIEQMRESGEMDDVRNLYDDDPFAIDGPDISPSEAPKKKKSTKKVDDLDEDENEEKFDDDFDDDFDDNFDDDFDE